MFREEEVHLCHWFIGSFGWVFREKKFIGVIGSLVHSFIGLGCLGSMLIFTTRFCVDLNVLPFPNEKSAYGNCLGRFIPRMLGKGPYVTIVWTHLRLISLQMLLSRIRYDAQGSSKVRLKEPQLLSLFSFS